MTKSIKDRLWNLAALALLLLMICYSAAGYGSRWTIGRYGMPHSLLAFDGEHYADGTEICEINQTVIRMGLEEESYLAALVWVLFLFGLVYAYARSVFNHKVRIAKSYVDRQVMLARAGLPHDNEEQIHQFLSKLYGVPVRR